MSEETSREAAPRASEDASTRRHPAEAELERFFMVSPEPLCVLSKDGRFVRHNGALTTTLGYSAEEIAATTLFELVHPEDVEATKAQIERIESTPMTVGLESRLRTRAGLYVWLAWSLLSVPDEGLVYAAARNVGKRKRLERAIMQRIEIKMLAASISSHFLDARLEDLDAGINSALTHLGTLLGAERVALMLMSEEGDCMTVTHDFTSRSFPPLSEEQLTLRRSERVWLFDKLEHCECIEIGSIVDLPPEAMSEARAIETLGVKSMLRVPVRYAGRLIGSLGLASIRERKTWDKDARALLRVMGEMFAVTLERKRAELALRGIIDQQRTAIQTLSTPIIQIWDDVLALPIVGSLDSRRAAEITDKLLHAIVSSKSRFAILDLTGVDHVDTTTAQLLFGILRAIELLGAQGVVSGIQPQVATTMVSLDIELSHLSLHADIQEALKWSMRQASQRSQRSLRSLRSLRSQHSLSGR